jgi:hypothetical protein
MRGDGVGEMRERSQRLSELGVRVRSLGEEGLCAFAARKRPAAVCGVSSSSSRRAGTPSQIHLRHLRRVCLL